MPVVLVDVGPDDLSLGVYVGGICALPISVARQGIIEGGVVAAAQEKPVGAEFGIGVPFCNLRLFA